MPYAVAIEDQNENKKFEKRLDAIYTVKNSKSYHRHDRTKRSDFKKKNRCCKLTKTYEKRRRFSNCSYQINMRNIE